MEKDENSKLFHKPDHNVTFEASTSVGLLLRSALRTADGLLLYVLSVAFLVFAFIPSAINRLTTSFCGQSNDEGIAIAFLVMPLALIGEYLWFGVGKSIRQTNALRFVVLLATAVIPFIKSCLG